ncbi:V-type ATP synthase subunit D [Candidatus Omnitrophota bacterium]
MLEVQFNKTYLLNLNKSLVLRQTALPILQNKEAALRAEVARIRLRIKELDEKIAARIESLQPMRRMWSEFPDIVKVEKTSYAKKKVASVTVKLVENVEFAVESFSLFASPAWFLQGITIIKEVIQLKIDRINEQRLLEQVELARRKTTQKVNLYEKVQIPFLEDAILKIKRYLEDEENLSKSSQKILKKRLGVLVEA